MMRRVILESPYAGAGRFWIVRVWRRWRNITYARACVRDSLMRNESPVASHLLYTQPGILDDAVPDERTLGINAGLAWRTVAEASVVYVDHGITRGMRMGIDAAREAGLPVELRRIGTHPHHQLTQDPLPAREGGR